MSENCAMLEEMSSDGSALSAQMVIQFPERPTQTDCPNPTHPVRNLERINLSRIRLTAYKITRNVTASSDIAQNILAKLLELTPERRNEISCFEAYAMSAARNAARNWLRTEDRNASLNEAAHLMDDSSDPVRLIGDEDEVGRLLARLPIHLQQPLVLCKMYGYCAEECAAELGISVELVWKRVQRAFDILRKEMLQTQKSRIRLLHKRKDL